MICPKCDGYGVVGVNGIAVKCDHPECVGYRTHAQAVADIRKTNENVGNGQSL